MAIYTNKYTKRSTTHRWKYIPLRAARFGFARFGRSRFGGPLITYTDKYSDRGTSYANKYT